MWGGGGKTEGKMKRTCFDLFFSPTNPSLCHWRKKFAFLRRRFIPSRVDCVSENLFIESSHATRDCSRATEIYCTDTASVIFTQICILPLIMTRKHVSMGFLLPKLFFIFSRLREMRSCCSMNLHLQFHLCRVFNEKQRTVERLGR